MENGCKKVLKVFRGKKELINKSMPFKLKSGNKTNFKDMGSSPLKQDDWSSGGEGMDWLKADLKSKGYKKRLQKELKLSDNKTIKTTPKKGDKYYTEIKNPTSKQIIAERKRRANKTVFNKPSEFDEDGRKIGYAHADHIDKKSGGTIKPGSDIFYSSDYDWKGKQANRLKDLNIHEGAHSITAGKHGMLPGTKDLLTKAKGGDASKGNINRPQEVYARYKVAQKWAQKQGDFDAFSGKEFTDKHYDKIMKKLKGVNQSNYKEKGIPYEVITFFGDDKKWQGHGFNKKMSKKHVKKIFNEVASNKNKNTNSKFA